jgi:Holliday junction DNA helicase RuvA
MIAHVSGVVAEKFIGSVIVDVHGVGYEIQIPAGDFDSCVLGEQVKFYTYHHIREQSQELFGFGSLAAKKLFELLITVQGVGPKAGLSILSIGDSEQVRNAIANSDAVYVSKATGVGKRIAERVIVDLADKVGLALQVTRNATDVQVPSHDEALEALIALGYTLADATQALQVVSTDLPTAARVMQALKAGV